MKCFILAKQTLYLLFILSYCAMNDGIGLPSPLGKKTEFKMAAKGEKKMLSSRL